MNFLVDKTGAGPYKSQCTFSKTSVLECLECEKGNLLTFPN